MVGFLFGGDTQETPESIKRKREIVRALMGASGAPKNIGEGINALGDGIVSAVLNERANRAEGEGRKSADSDFSALSSLFGAGEPAASPPGPSASLKPGVAAELSATNPSRAAAPVFANDGTELGAYLSDDARRATLPAGMRNNNPGNIKFVGQKVPGIVGPSVNTDQGDPQAVFDTPESGMKAMYSLLGKKYAGGKLTPNQMIAGNMGWTPGNYDAAKNVARTMGIGPDDDIGFSDPQRAAKFMQALILQEHGQKGRLYPESLITSAIGGRPTQPAQVASLDPAAGMPPSAAPQAQAYVDPAVSAPNPLSQGNPQGMVTGGTGQPASQQVAALPPQDASVPPPSAPPQNQVAQALRQPPRTSNAELQAAQKVLSNQFSSEGQRAVAQALLRQELERRNTEYEMQLKQQDPAYQLNLQKGQIELDNLRNPRISPAEQRRLDLDQQKFDFERNKPKNPEKVSQGEILVDPVTGKEIYKAAPKPDVKPSAVQEYEYAKGQGFPGTFQDWEASKKGGMSLQVDPATGAVTFQQGGNIKPMTEGQSKDAVFSTRAAGALPLVDKFGDSLTGSEGMIGGTVGQLPVVGNFAKTEGYQQAEQAGKEFLQAILRKDTGAAITKEETAEYGSVYLPRPGDSKELLAQKKASRVRALEAIKAGMPPQAILAQEKALANTAKVTEAPPDGIDPEDWKFMDEGQRKLFR